MQLYELCAVSSLNMVCGKILIVLYGHGFGWLRSDVSLQKVNDVVQEEDLPPPPPELTAVDDSSNESEERGPPPVAVKPEFSSPVKPEKPPIAAKPNFIKPPEVPETLPPPPVSHLFFSSSVIPLYME